MTQFSRTAMATADGCRQTFTTTLKQRVGERASEPQAVGAVRLQFALVILGLGLVPVMAHATTHATSVALAVSPSGSQSVGGVETLTATVTDTTASAQVTVPGTVIFCDDEITGTTPTGLTTGDYGVCGVKSRLGTGQIEQSGTTAGPAGSAGTAMIKVRLAPGTHYLYAIFLPTPGATQPLSGSTSTTATTGTSAPSNSLYPINGGTGGYSVSVTGSTWPLASVLSTTATPGDYTLTDTIISSPAASAPTSLSATFTDTTSPSQTLGSAGFGSTGSSVVGLAGSCL